MKKFVVLLCSMVLMISLVSCGNHSVHQGSEQVESIQKNDLLNQDEDSTSDYEVETIKGNYGVGTYSFQYFQKDTGFQSGIKSADQEKIKEIIKLITGRNYLAAIRQGVGIYAQEEFTPEAFDNGMAHELDSRILYEYFNNKDKDLKDTDLYVDFLDVTIKNNLARVVIDYRYQKSSGEVMLQQREAYLMKREKEAWLLAGVIFDDGGDNATIEAFRQADNPQQWMDKYDYKHLKRSDYTNAPTFGNWADENNARDKLMYE